MSEEEGSIASAGQCESSGPCGTYTSIEQEEEYVPCPEVLKNLKETKDIPPLKDYEGYESWKNNIFDTLQINGMYKFFVEGKIIPTEKNKLNRWIQANSWIRQLLLRSIAPELARRLQLSRVTNFYDMYNRVKKHVLSLGQNCVSVIQYKWDHLKFTTLDDTIATMYELQSHIETLTERKMTNRELVDKLIKVVPERLQRSAIDARYSQPDIDFEELVGRLKCHCSLEEQRKAEERVMHKSQLHQPTHKTKHKNFTNTEQPSSPKEIQTKLYCKHCKKKGHTEEKCFKLQECLKCKQKGHIAKYCREKKREVKLESTAAKNLLNLQHVRVETNQRESWLFDPGSSAKVVNEKHWFIDYTPLKDKKIFQVGNGGVSEAYGKGKVKAQVFIEDKWVDAIIHDVYYIPACPFNLWTPKSLLKEGICIKEDDKGHVKLSNANGTILEGKNEHGLIWLHIRQVRHQLLLHKTLNTKLWHQRLAHTDPAKIKLMSKNQAVKGLGEVEDVDFKCEPCLRTRATKPRTQSFGKREDVKPGEAFSCDLSGPFIESIHSNKYFVICKDEATGYREIYFTRSKSATEVSEKVASYIKFIETQVNVKVKRMRTDNGLEFTGKTLEEIIREKGIIHELTQVEGPWQNPCERDNRTIVEKVRSILSEGAFPPLLWDELANTVAYIHNRVLNRREKEKTPFELLFKTKPSVYHLKVLGCTAYVNKLFNEKESKLSENAFKGLLVGYDDQSNRIYRIYIPETNKVVRSASVRFNEEEMPLLKLKQNEEVANLREQIVNQFKLDEMEESDDEVLMAITDEKLPNNYKQAIDSEESSHWKKAIEDELNSIKEHNVYTLVTPPSSSRILESRWVFVKKYNENGQVDKYKARLVVKGYNQILGIDFQDTFSPVTTYTTIRILLALAAQYKMIVKQLDVKTAFLHGNIDTVIYVKQPEGCNDGTNRVWLLNKSLYGLKQSPRLWHQKVKSILDKFDLKPTLSDPCCFKNKNSDLILALWVDDGIVMGRKEEAVNKLLNFLQSELNITTSNINKYVGLEITQQNECIYVREKNYIERVVQRFNLTQAKITQIPADPALDKLLSESLTAMTQEELPNKEGLDKEMEGKPTRAKTTTRVKPSDKRVEKETAFPYREAVGALNFIAHTVRPDIAFAVNRCAQFCHNYNHLHVKAVKNIIRYLKGTSEIGLTYTSDTKMNLTCYADADYAGDKETRKSVSGYVVCINGSPVAWTSRKQTIVAQSTMEAEYYSVCESTKEILFVLNLLKELNTQVELPVNIYNDNQAAIINLQDAKYSNKNKHLDLRVKMIRSHQNKEVKTVYIPTEQQPADFLTKPLARGNFVKCRERLKLTLINFMMLFAHVSASTFSMESPIIASKPNRYSQETSMYMVTSQQVVSLNYLFLNPCSIITEREGIEEIENRLSTTRIAKQSCENRAFRLFYAWKSIDDGDQATEKFTDPSNFYIPTESRFNSNRLTHKFRFKRGIWLIIGIVILASAVVSVVHNAITAATDIVRWDKIETQTNNAIEKASDEIISSLQAEIWDLSKNMTMDMKYFAYYNEANNHLLETLINVSNIINDWSNNKVTRQFFDTLGIKWPDDRPPFLIKPISMHVHAPASQPFGRKAPWNMTFHLMTATINKHADVRKIDAFTLYERNASLFDGYDWCKIKYIGPPAVTANGPTCRVEFANKVGDQTYVGTRCTSKTYNEKEVTNRENYELWEKECFKESYKPFRPEAQIKTINDRNYIYCPNYTITRNSVYHEGASRGVMESSDPCPDYVFSLPISTSFTLQEVNYKFDGLEEHINSSNRRQEEEIQRMISSYIIPNRNFIKDLKPINVPSPSYLSYWRTVMWVMAITISIMIIVYVWKCIFSSSRFVHHRIQVMRRERKRVKDLINYHEQLKKNKKLPSAPPMPEKPKCNKKCRGTCHMV